MCVVTADDELATPPMPATVPRPAAELAVERLRRLSTEEEGPAYEAGGFD